MGGAARKRTAQGTASTTVTASSTSAARATNNNDEDNGNNKGSVDGGRGSGSALLHGGLGNDAGQMARCPFSPGGAENTAGGWPSSQMPADEHVQLFARFGDFAASQGSVRLLADIGGGDRIRELFTLFYAKAFQDRHLDAFMFESDGAEEHGRRFGDWIVEKMGGEGTPWSDSGRHGLRAATHRQAWESVRRPANQRGRRFKVHDCVVWMRLLFWAGRELRLNEHKPFWGWFVSFIQHFIAVYERWSADVNNIQTYIDDGRWMSDILQGIPKANLRATKRTQLVCPFNH